MAFKKQVSIYVYYKEQTLSKENWTNTNYYNDKSNQSTEKLSFRKTCLAG